MLLLSRASSFLIRHIPQTCNPCSFFLDHLDLLGSILRQDLSSLLKALEGQLLEWHTACVCHHHTSSARTNGGCAFSNKTSFDLRVKDGRWVGVSVEGLSGLDVCFFLWS